MLASAVHQHESAIGYTRPLPPKPPSHLPPHRAPLGGHRAPQGGSLTARPPGKSQDVTFQNWCARPIFVSCPPALEVASASSNPLHQSASGPSDCEGHWCLWRPWASSTFGDSQEGTWLQIPSGLTVHFAHTIVFLILLCGEVTRQIPLALLYYQKTWRWRVPLPSGWAEFPVPADLWAVFPRVLRAVLAIGGTGDDDPLCRGGAQILGRLTSSLGDTAGDRWHSWETYPRPSIS